MAIYALLSIWLFLLFVVNIALVVYFIWTFERLFIIMKAGSLKDLLTYKQEVNQPKPIKEYDDDMP